jgi:transcriptional regulator with PAS, ATPase and Fis domain
MERQEEDYGINETLYRKIEQVQTREDILKVFEEERYKITPQRVWQLCFYYAFDKKHDQVAAKKFLNIFHDDLKESTKGIFNLVKSTMRLLGYPDIFISDVVEVNGTKFLTSEDKWIRDIYYRSKYDQPLLIVGETGTGKGILAHSIHEIGPRRNKKFQEINCAAIPENLLESELFGYVGGAFTGAVKKKKTGLFELASGGTVFLDELGKMAKYLQAKILKVIEKKEITPVGSGKAIKIDVRFIAAAQPKDEREIILDLLNRLGFPDCIELPTLEERLRSREEIGNWLIESSLKRVKDNMGFNKAIKISETAYRQLLEHKYPGNFRELENILKSAIRSMDIDGRTKIQAQDLVDILRKSMTFYKDKETSSFPDADRLKDIKLKDIINYAQEQKSLVIKTKINELLKSGKNVRSVLINEGLSEKEYLNFVKKIRTITGKNLRELGF